MAKAKKEPYKPVICKQCRQEVRQVIEIELEAPLGWNDFTKHGLRASCIKLNGARWNSAVWKCACGVRHPPIRDTRPGPLTRKDDLPDLDARDAVPERKKNKKKPKRRRT